MSVTLRRSIVETKVEDKIITGLIISDRFCRDAVPLIRYEYFQSPFARRIAKWATEYYQRYDKAVSSNIQDLFEFEKENLKEEEARLVESFLSSLSDKYEQDGVFNSDFLLDEATKYFKRRSMEIVSDNVKALVEVNKIPEAEEIIAGYKAVSKTLSNWVNPFDPKYIDKVFNDVIYPRQDGAEMRGNALFTFSGDLGKMLGPFERGWLVIVLGPAKRGKTWWLQEFAIQALYKRLKVAFVTLEMSAEEMSERIYHRLTATVGSTSPSNELVYPIIDCYRNQAGTCSLPERTNMVKLLTPSNEKPSLSKTPFGYKTCSVCRGRLGKQFIGEYWFETIRRDYIHNNIDAVKKVAMSQVDLYGDNLRVMSYPTSFGTLKQMEADLDVLNFNEGFWPDIIVVDYLDILELEGKGQEFRHRVNDTWKKAKGIGQKRHALMVSGSQSNKESEDKKSIKGKDASEDWRKNANVDMMMFLNQTDVEKDHGIMRIGFMHRHKYFHPSMQVSVLQQLHAGQPFLDSENYYGILNSEDLD